MPLTRLAEQPKCDRYWPEDSSTSLTFDPIGLTVCLLNEMDFENYTLRNIKVQQVSRHILRNILAVEPKAKIRIFVLFLLGWKVTNSKASLFERMARFWSPREP